MTRPSLRLVIKVLLVGSRPMSLAGLRALIDDENDMTVVGVREHMNAAAAPLDSSADIAVVDHTENDTAESLIQLGRGAGGAPQCVVLTASTDVAQLSEVFRLGARGLVFAHQSAGVLIDTIRRVHRGEICLDRSAATQLITDLLSSGNTKPRKKRPTLSSRNRRIVELVSRGLRNREIAKALRVSEATVRNQLTSIFKKVGVTGRLQLAIYASQEGLVKLQQPTKTTPKRNLRLV